MKNNNLQKNETIHNGEYHWKCDSYIIDVVDGEIVYAGSTENAESKNYKVQTEDFDVLIRTLKICFCINEKEFISIYKALSKNSVCFSFAKTILREKVKKLKQRLEIFENLL